MDAIALKTIYYRGGVVTFRIPARWQEGYEEAGGGTFYKAGDDTGTLRLNVLTLEAPAGKPIIFIGCMVFSAARDGNAAHGCAKAKRFQWVVGC